MKANIKYMKEYDKNKESLYLKYWYVNNSYGWAIHKSYLSAVSSRLKRFFRKVQCN